jgi:hypothetical protein
VESIPRIKDLGGMLELNIVIEEEPEENFFSSCHCDNDEDFERCFEYDWKKGNIDRLLPDL